MKFQSGFVGELLRNKKDLDDAFALIQATTEIKKIQNLFLRYFFKKYLVDFSNAWKLFRLSF